MSLIYNLTFSFEYSLPVIKPLIFFLLLCRRRNMWGSCWCGNVLRQQHATVASEWRHTLYPPPPQPTASQRLSEALKLPGAWLALDRHYCLFLRFSSHSGSLLMPAETFRGAIVWLPFHIYMCLCHYLVCVRYRVCCSLWKHCGTQSEDQQLFTESWKALVSCSRHAPQCFLTSFKPRSVASTNN